MGGRGIAGRNRGRMQVWAMPRLTSAIVLLLALVTIWLAAPLAAASAGWRLPCTFWPASHFPCRGEQTSSAILQRRPLAAVQWLMRAETLAREKADGAAFRQALSMAYLAAPLEGNIVLPRAMLGVEHWDRLDGALKQRVARDLAMSWKFMTVWHRSRIAATVAVLPETGRADMLQRIANTPGMTREGLRHMGFAP